MTGHVEGARDARGVSRNVQMLAPGGGKDSIRDLRKTKVKDVGNLMKPGDLDGSLVEDTHAALDGDGRGLNTDGPKRSKIQPIRRPMGMEAPELPALRVPAPNEAPVDPDAAHGPRPQGPCRPLWLRRGCPRAHTPLTPDRLDADARAL